MENFEIVAVTELFRDAENQELYLNGRCFLSVAAAHSDWVHANPIHPSLKHIGCYEARGGLSVHVEKFKFDRVVGKCFPFHMVLESPPCPFQQLNDQSDQWWVLVRLKHTCPPVTFRDI